MEEEKEGTGVRGIERGKKPSDKFPPIIDVEVIEKAALAFIFSR